MIEATLMYLEPMAERPYYYRYEPPAGMPWRNTRGDRREVAVHDARRLDPPAALSETGFVLIPHATAVGDLYDADAVRASYYPEMEALVARATGARRVVAFDHNVRSRPKADRNEDNASAPIYYAHNDYTEQSGLQRVRDLLPDEADELLERPSAVVNVWKPIAGPVRRDPLAVCDARTIAKDDFVPTELRYRDRTGEVYSMVHRDSHRWYYYPEMRADEALLLLCYDSRGTEVRYTAHTSFDDPASPNDAPHRESIEVRTLVFFD